jgi:hypothetical protein
MLRDVFYYGEKPNAHPREQFAENLADARQKCTTEHFWIINEFCDYRNFDWDFDFEFLPDEDVWAEDHNNVWPSQHQKDSGTWLCSNEHSDTIIYRNDVNVVLRKNEKQSDFWVELDLIDHSKFDFSWHPDPTDPPYIYKWGCKFFPAVLKHVLEYHVPGATQEKYMTTTVELLPQTDYWIEHQLIDKHKFDMSWRPNPLDPPFIYIWGNKYIDGKLKPTLEYRSPEATTKKYMAEHLVVLPEWDNWVEVQSVDKTSFDFSWRPDPREPDLIYVFGNEHYDAIKMPTVEYHCEGATERKYMDTQVAKLAPNTKLYEHLEDSHLTDYSWMPDPDSRPYIYVWGNQWNAPEDKISVQITVPGATEYKYMPDRAIRKPCLDNWVVPDDVDTTGFDFSWEPSPAAPPYIYEFATQWQKTGGPQYVVPGATEKQYFEFQKVTKLPSKENWTIPDNIDSTGFDFSWHPDDTSPPYNYVFATQWAFSGGPVYAVDGATEIKYVDDQVATAKKEMTNWVYDSTEIDIDSFDFSWHPYVEDQPYIYEFGTQWQKTGGPKYITPGADSSSPKKYIDTRILKAKRLPSDDNWKSNYDIKDFDYSWHPDNTEEPFIYVFGNNLYSAEECATMEYHVKGATEIKYVTDVIATLDVNTNWEIPPHLDTTGFDFAWIPNPNDPLYIYEFGTQHQKTGGPRYVVPGATETKYLDFQTVTRNPIVDEHWEILENTDKSSFDFSWHPDASDPLYIYAWGNQWVSAEDRPCIEYRVSGATEYRYMDNSATRLPTQTNWKIPDDLDTSEFDFSWEPSPAEEPYIYQFGTQWQKTGGPRYVVPGATEIKYVDLFTAKKLSSPSKFIVVDGFVIEDFDYSWHPDETEDPFIYVFGNNLYSAEECATIEYHVSGATERKYVSDLIATLGVNSNWEVPPHIDTTGFDFSWVPNPNDPPYIYEFATQWQKTGGPRYTVSDATEIKYLDFQQVIALSNKDNWKIPSNVYIADFDFSWHPDNTDPGYIYQFGTQWALSGGPAYCVPNATEIKYMDEQTAVALPSKDNWVYDSNLIDIDSFDFSWHPYVEDQPYIYEFGTQWQKTGGPKYFTPGADSSSPTKYIDTRIIKSKRLPNPTDNWKIVNDYKVKDFDYSWHPDSTEEPFIYVFGNNLYPAEECPTVEYRVSGATKRKYVGDIVATLGDNADNWVITQPIDESKFDFSWIPNPKDPPYVYRWGNRYISNKYKPTIEYVVPGATDIKYMSDDVAVLPEMDKWDIPKNVDTSGFNFAWRPDPLEPDQIYQFGTQWQKTGGPRYVVPGATEIKYLDFQKVVSLPNKDNWKIPSNVDIVDFDFSWHPDDTDPAYIYQFGTQWALSGGPAYHVSGATEIKYMDEQTALALPNKDNWVYDPTLIDAKTFDFSWHPYAEDQPYIYEFGTQWQKTGGPKYFTPGADSSSPIKYIDTRILKATRLPNKENKNWVSKYKIKDFDFSWHPDDTEEPFIYVFGNTLYPAEECATIEYQSPGATKTKYVHEAVATLAANMDNWEVPKGVDTTEFDFGWIPNPNEPPYIYEFGTQWQKTGGPRYVVSDAVETKYVDFQHATVLPNRANWTIADNINVSEFDFSWHPDSTEPAYIYRFGTQWALSGGPVYTVPGATELKYMDNPSAIALPDKSNWKYDQTLIDVDSFDFSWHPYAEDEPFIYQFGTQHQKTGGPRYFAPGATNRSSVKYVDTRIIKATRLANKSNHWKVQNGYEIENFDYSWHPDETTEPYIYVFGNTQYSAEEMPTIQYVEQGAESLKYINNVKAKLAPNMANWNVPKNIDASSVDFSWVPHPKSPPYIYEFATIWNDRGGPSYVVPGATEHFYVEDVKAKTLTSRTNWEVPKNIDVRKFDFSWVPHPLAPPYIYQFGSKLDNNDGPRYITPDNNGEIVYLERVELENDTEVTVGQYYIETTLEDLVNQHPNEVFWALRTNINYDEFDFTWQPESLRDLEYVQVFGSTESELTQTYYVSANNYLRGNTSFKFVETVDLTEETLVEMFVKPDMFYVDRSNPESAARFEALKAKFGTKIQKTRYLNSWVDTVNRCINRSTTDLVWILNSELDYSNFDFDYYPNPWQMKMVHVFGTQWNHWGTTFMVNRESFPEDTKYVKIIEHLSTLNFVKERRAIATSCVYDIIVVDHGNQELSNVLEVVNNKTSGRTVTTVPYNNSYFDTLKDIIKRQQEKKEHYIWICSSVCDYTDFDFSYICDPYAKDQLHVFPSGMQKFGDTFFVDVNKARELVSDMEKLEDFHKVNFNSTIKVKRLPEPVIVTSDDTQVAAIKNVTGFPYATLVTEDNMGIEDTVVEPMNLWSPESKNILITSTGGTRIVVPKEAKDHVTNELYEYPYIKRMPKLAKSKALDIVFVSNGELVAEQNYEHLSEYTRGLANKMHRVDGINGRTEALHTAAEQSETPWFFCVPAKLLVNKKFDWNYQADRMQMPKHYIFNAHNPVNDLFYGHQSMVLYNKNLVLNNKGVGLDFTLDSTHMTVELNSGIVVGDTDAHSTWRTAFREAVKLKRYSDNGDETAQQRLDVWTSVGKGSYGAWSIEGALDGLEFYDEVNGDLTQLRQSYYWDWLRDRFDSKY